MAYKQPLNQKKKPLFKDFGGTDVGDFFRNINFLKKDPAKGGTGHIPYDPKAPKGTTGTKFRQNLENLTSEQKKAIADGMKPLGESSVNSDYLDKSMDFLNRRSTTNWDALTLGGPAGSQTPTDMKNKIDRKFKKLRKTTDQIQNSESASQRDRKHKKFVKTLSQVDEIINDGINKEATDKGATILGFANTPIRVGNNFQYKLQPKMQYSKHQAENYDAKMAYNKNLSGKARLHYLENNIADHKGPSASKSMLNLGTPYKMGMRNRGPIDKISNPIKGNAFIKAKIDAEARGDKSFEVGGKTYPIQMKGDSPMEASYSKGPKMPTPLNGYASDAQRKAVHASKADGGKGNPNNMKVPLMMPKDPKEMLKTKIKKLSDQHKDLYDRVIEGYGPSRPGEEKKLYRIEDKLEKQEEKYKKKFGGSPYDMGHKK